MASLLREPALPLLLATSVAMVVREYVPDIVLFVGVSVLVVVDAGRWDGSGPRSSEPTPAGTATRVLAALALPVACLVALLPRSSTRLDLAFGVVGVVALWCCCWPGRGRTGPDALRQTSTTTPHLPPPRWTAWPALGLSVALVELWSFAHETSPRVSDPAHPTLSTVTEPMLGSAPARAVAVWWWLLAGIWLLRRVRAWTA